MYESSPMAVLEWAAAVPNYIPDQAVIFETRQNNDAMFVARVLREDGEFDIGLFTSDTDYAEYALDNLALRTEKFDFLVSKHGKSAITLSVVTEHGVPFLPSIILHYDDVIMSMIASQIISLAFVYSTVYSGADQRKHQSSVSLAFVWGIHRGPVNSPHKWSVTRKMFPFDDVIMKRNYQTNFSISTL